MSISRLVAVAMATVLCGCGGGGSSSGTSADASSGTLAVSTNSLTFYANGPTDATPAAKAVAGSVTGVSSGSVYVTITGTGAAIASISTPLYTSSTTAQSMVSVPSPSTLGVGTYTGTITVQACLNDSHCATGNLTGSPQTINVTYYVAALQSSKSSLDYTVTNTSSASDLTQQFTITGVPAQTWTARTDANWLTVTTSGNTGDALTATVTQSQLDTMTDGVYSATIAAIPGTAGQSLSIPVSLTVKRTEVDYVTPYVAYAGTSRSVVISGAEFSQVTISAVQFGTTSAQSFSVIGPNQIRAIYPATLTPGRYPVMLQSNATNIKQLAELVVVNAPSFTAAALPMASTDVQQPFAIVYDAERAAVAVNVWHENTGATGLVKFQSSGNSWLTPIEKSAMNMYGIALSADGAEWVAGSNFNLLHIDPNDLSTLATVVTPLNGGGNAYPSHMVVASNGTVAMFGDVLFYGCGSTLLDYNPRQKTFTTPSYTACRSHAGASADGSRVLLGNQFPDFGTNDIFLHDTSTGALTPTGIFQFIDSDPALDRTGSRIVLKKTQVYDAAYTSLGSLPASTLAVVLSPDGDRAYTYDQSKQMRTFDLTATPVSGVFPEVGTGIALAGDPGNQDPHITITPDGRTAFITGGAALIVQPTP